MNQFISMKKKIALPGYLCRLVWLVLAVIATTSVRAQYDGGITDSYNGVSFGIALPGNSGNPLLQGATGFVSCPAGGTAEISSARKIINIVRFYLHEETEKYLGTNFTASIDVKIEYGPDAGSLSQHTRTFTVSYSKDEGVKYNAKNYFSFEGAAYVKITAMSNVTPATAGTVNLADVLVLENEMRVTRYFDLQPGISPVSFSGPASVNNPVDASPVTWSWPANSGHNATQLEWTWLENELAPGYYIPNTTTVDVSKLFQDNATRIDLPFGKNNFSIPLFYDGAGQLYYRIRPVNIKNDGSRRDGAWTTPVSGAGICSYSGHNDNMNWQVRSSFAEEGKMKSVMAYYDGSLRSRQTVTKDNVENSTVTAETFYDYEGRPAIQILPVPGISGSNNIIQYQANLNLFNSQSQNQNPADLFDLHPVNATGAALYSTPALVTTTGASKYYSPSNPEISTGANKNIPDAEGYPYTVTRYTPDATGRIMSRSGVGPTHQLGSGKETRYYYGTPSQEELDGLFGTEVGIYSHYFKNMVKDANGQMSVSYVDMHGRTIATALAGESPGNLLPLNITSQQHYPNQSGSSIKRNLLDANTNVEKGNSIESVNTLLVPAATNYTFRYELNPESLELASCNNPPATLCYECLYDLEISITNESGETVPVVYNYTNVGLYTTEPDDNCTTHNEFVPTCDRCTTPIPVNNVIEFTQLLQPGSYAVRKTLTISESSLQKYREMYMQPGKGICKTEQEIIDSVYAVLLQSSDCNTPPVPACEQCQEELGTFSDFRTNYLASLGYAPDATNIPAAVEQQITAAFNTANEACNNICNTASPVTSSKRQLMLADMMPYGGQYATETAPNVPAGVTMFNKYNIFSTAFNASIQPYYKKPKAANGLFDFYRDHLGNKDLQIHPDGTLTLLSNTAAADFAGRFVYEWANSLLPYHPEYPRLQYAENVLAPANVYNWISSFQNTGTYALASSGGYIMTSNGTITDPLYTVAGIPAQYKTDMTSWITNNYAGSNLSLWQIARGQLRCQNATNPASCFSNSLNGLGQIVKIPPFADVSSTADLNQLWQNFRTLYAAARDNQLNTFIVAQQPLADDATLIAQGFQLRFGTTNQTAQQNGWTWFPATVGGAPTLPSGFPANSTAQTYSDRCSSYIEQWKRSLLQCGTLANMTNTTLRDQILDEITTAMQLVCVKGSDASNPYGSSTVKPSTPADGSPRSFEEVINQVFATHNINPPKDYYCNPYVIEFPKPYGKNPVFTKEYTTVVDSCACAGFNTIKTQALAASYNPNDLSSINDYLQLNNLDTLTSVLHAALLNCSSYQQQVCDTIRQEVTVSCYDPQPCTILCAPRMLVEKTANKGGGEPVDCEEWTNLIACFYDTYGSLINTQTGCQSDFVNYYNASYQTSLTWNDIAALYYATCGEILNVCTSCTTDAKCLVPGDCYTVFVPYTLSSPQPLPAFLKCGYVPAKCLTCDSMALYTAEFKTIFAAPYNAGPHFTAANLSQAQIEQNILYSRFLNFRTGFQYNWLEYAQAAAVAGCNPLNSPGAGVTDLLVTSRSGNTPAQYIASNSITFDPNFESAVGDVFETLLEPGGGGAGPQTVICRNNVPLNDTTGIFMVDTACHRVRIMAIQLGQQVYQQQLLTLQANFEQLYREKCMAAKNNESFTVTYTNKEYHYTLYYYDMAGSLVKTVPPKGVRPDFTEAFTNSVKAARITDSYIQRPHEYVTQYRYNSLGAVVAQKSPDASTDLQWSKFWYDKLGRLAVSQNAQQALDNKYSYTRYDALGRIIEVGQKPQNSQMTQLISQDEAALNDWIMNQGNTREEITITGYDVEFEPNRRPLIHQQNLRNRVSYTAFRKFANDPQPPPYYTGTIYTYDIHGNVDTLLQDYSGIAEMASTNNTFKRITYNYDLISGKVNMVSYQPDYYDEGSGQWVRNADKFFHKYEYDAENKLTQAWTSRDKIEWEREAAYQYYKYGPLSRTVLGQQQVQGIDYAYTIQGWLKGVNGTTVGDGSADMGADGFIGGSNSKVARDIYGFALHYFDDGNSNLPQAAMDYKPVGVQVSLGGGGAAFARPNNPAFVSLYNGNIGAMSVNNAGLLKAPAASTNALPLFYNYRYDQLNRIRSMNVFSGLQSNNSWQPLSINDYAEAVTYDPNGNILTYNRKGSPAIAGRQQEMDNLTYTYYANKNQLRQVTDNPAYSSYYAEDIDTQTDPDNYTYDAIGNLKKDVAEGITNISWTVYGKISSITKSNGMGIAYTYDAAGNRVTKTITNPPTGVGRTTIYVRDAGGNVMSIYEKPLAGAIEQTELHIYGSSRLGIVNKLTVAVTDINLEAGYGKAFIRTFTRGEKSYELSNHLGNVLVSITDKKIQVQNGSTGLVHYYVTDVVMATDYYPGGMELPGRTYTTGNGYRYSINGQEKTPEIGPNTTTAEFWQYDARIVRRWNVDPVFKENESPYATFGNNPIWSVDVNGADSSITQKSIAATVDRMRQYEDYLKVLKESIAATKQNIEIEKTNYLLRLAEETAASFTIPGLIGSLIADGLNGGKSASEGWGEMLASDITRLNNLVTEFNKYSTYYSNAITVLKADLESAKTLTLDNGVKLENLSMGGVAVAGVHKNLKSFVGNWNIYEIIVDGKTYKFGIADATRIRKGGEFAGLPERLAQQLVKIQGLAAKTGVKLDVTYTISKPLLQMMKAKALELESNAIKTFAAMNGIPLGNKMEIAKWAAEFGLSGLSAKAIKALKPILKLPK